MLKDPKLSSQPVVESAAAVVKVKRYFCLQESHKLLHCDVLEGRGVLTENYQTTDLRFIPCMVTHIYMQINAYLTELTTKSACIPLVVSSVNTYAHVLEFYVFVDCSMAYVQEVFFW